MRSSVRSLLWTGLLWLVVVAPLPASAQGFFESLFGGGQPSPPASIPRQGLPPALPSPYGYRTPLFSPYRLPSPRDVDEAPQSRSGSFRTVCVRLCDGYYWPISHAVNRSSFYRDANACRASCGEEARLFYHPANQGDVNEMVDLTGRAYAKLPNAFRYRKALNEACKCKPDPWAQSELDRHQRYAINETVEDRKRRDRLAGRSEDPAGPDSKPPQTADAQPERDGEPPLDTADATKPGLRPDPIESPRPRAKRADTFLDSRPGAQQRGPARPPVVAKPAAQPVTTSPFGLGGPAKSRWPGD
ncbi:MAG: DUF2865 domain-containing protein [Hyphomicrobiaceae bacterium]